MNFFMRNTTAGNCNLGENAGHFWYDIWCSFFIFFARTTRNLRSVLTAYEKKNRVFLCSSYVGFVPVSDLLDKYYLIWRGVFLSMFLFVTDPKPKFGWRVFEGPRSPKTFHVLGDPKRLTKKLQCFWGCLDLAMPLGLSNFQIYFSILAIYHLTAYQLWALMNAHF